VLEIALVIHSYRLSDIDNGRREVGWAEMRDAPTRRGHISRCFHLADVFTVFPVLSRSGSQLHSPVPELDRGRRGRDKGKREASGVR